MKLVLDGNKIGLGTFLDLLRAREPRLEIHPDIISKIETQHAIILKHARGKTPIYGLNTGLGANLGHRLQPSEVLEFQKQIIRGRAFAVGEPLPGSIVRGTILARIISASHGGSGMSLSLLQTLKDWFESGGVPTVPENGSIGASDLTQNAHIGLCLIGEATVEAPDGPLETAIFLKQAGLTAHDPQPKDAMALINHCGLTVSLAGHAIAKANESIAAARAAGLLSLVGYQANTAIFSPAINRLRGNHGQIKQAQWFAAALNGCEWKPRRIQEALSFRLMAPIFGAAYDTLERATTNWTDDLNGISDSPVVLEDGEMASTPNFVSPALALDLENLSLVLGQLASTANQRLQKMMNPELSGLPRYLAPSGGSSAGFVPLQKTAAGLLGEIQQLTQPVNANPPPVSDSVEDWAPMTPLTAKKLQRQVECLNRLIALEAIVACQAIELREPEPSNDMIVAMRKVVRAHIDFRGSDSSPGYHTKSLQSMVAGLSDLGR